jgi:hypothetical protein
MNDMITLRPVILESDLRIGIGDFTLGAKGLVVDVRGTIVSPNEEALVAAFNTPSLIIADVE